MERDDQAISGWRRFKHSFTFGAAARSPEQQEPITIAPYERESLGYGCSRVVVDFDKLDQQ